MDFVLYKRDLHDMSSCHYWLFSLLIDLLIIFVINGLVFSNLPALKVSNSQQSKTQISFIYIINENEK